MNLTPELIVALSGLIVGVLAWADKFYQRWSATRTESRKAETEIKRDELATRRDELTLLRDELAQQSQRASAEIARLTARVATVEQQNRELHDQVLCLERERAWLRFTLAQNGITVPPMPETWQ